MIMCDIYLNELSLDGQYGQIDDFLDASVPVMRCLKFIYENNKQVYKYTGFFERKITNNMKWNDLRGFHSDKARRLKSLLLSTTDHPPFWDTQKELKQDISATYRMGDTDVTLTSVAEAAEGDGILLSFSHEVFNNCQIRVTKNATERLEIESAVTLDYLADQLWNKKQIDIHQYLCVKYEGTRLNFTKLDTKYGFLDFEKEELRDCFQTFDKFVHMENWNEIFRDQGLRYKNYSPSSNEKNWFSGSRYSGKAIDKFRCINPKRCFGYREDDIFYVLRMERDHRISDYG